MGSKEKIRDKYWDEKRPAYDLDRVEIYVPELDLDAFLREYAQSFVRWAETDISDILKNRRRHDKLIYKIFRAAAACLTNRQFQIFILRYKCLFKEREIARQAGVDQSYVSNVLKVCHSKIRRELRLEIKKKRKPKKRGKTRRKITARKRTKTRGRGRGKNTSRKRYEKKS